MATKLLDIGKLDDDSYVPPKIKDVPAPEFEGNRVLSGQLEFATLVQCVLDPSLQERLWPRLTPEHFASDTGLSLYKRLRNLSGMQKEWPSLSALAMDPALTPATKTQLTSVVAKIEKGQEDVKFVRVGSKDIPLSTSKDFEGHVFDTLDALRVVRGAMDCAVSMVEKISDEETFDPLRGPEIVERAATEIMAIRGNEKVSENIIHFGADLTPEDIERQRQDLDNLFQKGLPRIPTGLTAYDSVAKGFQPGELVLLGATTGGGKTAMCMSLGVNMARRGHSSAFLQLELSKEQLEERLICHLGRIDSQTMRNRTQNDTELEEKSREIIASWQEECLVAGARYTMWAPSSMTVAGCEMVFKQYPYSVWFIDYVSLLKSEGIDIEKGWEKLSEISKKFKRLAKLYRIVVCLCVQIDVDAKTGLPRVRYARAMGEDADIIWVWAPSDEEKKHHKAIWIDHLKSRQYEPFPFEVGMHLEFFSFEDLVYTEKSKRTLGKRRVHRKDEVELSLAGENEFKKKEKPLAVDPSVEIRTFDDDPTAREPLDLGTPDTYDEFDSEDLEDDDELTDL